MKGLNEHSGRYSFDTFYALMNADAANEIMLRCNPESSFVNGIVTELKQSVGLQNSIISHMLQYLRNYGIKLNCISKLEKQMNI